MARPPLCTGEGSIIYKLIESFAAKAEAFCFFQKSKGSFTSVSIAPLSAHTAQALATGPVSAAIRFNRLHHY